VQLDSQEVPVQLVLPESREQKELSAILEQRDNRDSKVQLDGQGRLVNPDVPDRLASVVTPASLEHLERSEILVHRVLVVTLASRVNLE